MLALAAKRKYNATPLTSLAAPLVPNLIEVQKLPVATLIPLGASVLERAHRDRKLTHTGLGFPPCNFLIRICF